MACLPLKGDPVRIGINALVIQKKDIQMIIDC